MFGEMFTDLRFKAIWTHLCSSFLTADELFVLSQTCSAARAFFTEGMWEKALLRQFKTPGVGTDGKKSYRFLQFGKMAAPPPLFLSAQVCEEGFIELFNGVVSGILMDDKPLTLEVPVNWDGSLVRLYQKVHPRDGEQMEKEVASLAQVLASGVVDLSQGFAEQFKLIPRLFKGGAYDLEFEPSVTKAEDQSIYGRLECDTPGREYKAGYVEFDFEVRSHAYSNMDVVLFSQPHACFDEARIDFYKNEIALGRRPIILCAYLSTVIHKKINWSC
jgi:hypothetical protein